MAEADRTEPAYAPADALAVPRRPSDECLAGSAPTVPEKPGAAVRASEGVETLPGVLVLAQVSELRTISVVNMVLAMCAVAYIAVNIVCIVLNSFDNDCNMEDPGCDAATSKATFHGLEFWATFAFNVLDVVALAYSPKRLSAIFWNPSILKMVMFLNITGSLCSALLVTINLEKFEIPAHELEYTNELTMAFCDLVILGSLIRGLRGAGASPQKRSLAASGLMVLLAGCVALVQLGVYNLSGWDGGESRGEQAAHYCEFIFAIISSSITFWFTMDNKFIADVALSKIMSNDVPRMLAK